jgi:hypothetical protein
LQVYSNSWKEVPTETPTETPTDTPTETETEESNSIEFEAQRDGNDGGTMDVAQGEGDDYE